VVDNFRVGPWLVEPGLNTVTRNGTTIRLEPKQMQVLVCLAQHPGETVAKESLLQAAWPRTFVSDDVLVRSISELRRVFEDDAKNACFIQTIPKRGYRLAAAVAPVNGTVPISALPERHTSFLGLGVGSVRSRIVKAILLGSVPVLGLLVVFNVGGWRDQLWRRKTVPAIQSLAVLPLQSLSGDPSQEYFADGMTEELITELSHLNGLKVISRTSVMRYKKTDKTLREIARELNVDAIVEGSLLRSGNRVRITAQLIRASTDSNLWADTYDRDLQDVLAIQSTVARAIANEIQVKMTPNERVQLRDPRPMNPAALDAYLKGEYHMGRFGTGFGKEERYMAMPYFQQAIQLDPNFARAYLGLAEAHTPNVAPAPDEVSVARGALEKALAADPNLSDAHLLQARFKEFHDWDFPAADKEFRQAIELDPSSAWAHDFYGDYLDNMGRHQEAAQEQQSAQALDPGWDHLIDGFNHRGEYGRALEIALSNVEVHPNDGGWHAYLAYVYLHTGKYKEMIGELQHTVTLYGYPELAPPLARTYATSGYRSALRLWANDLVAAQHNPASPSMVAEIYAHLGDTDMAFKWLERAYQERDGFLLTLRDPQWQALRSDPRFKDLIRRVGLP
jgi:TolB-like protein/DNA-binding winged helix-turn-helix (wHTH) protein